MESKPYYSENRRQTLTKTDSYYLERVKFAPLSRPSPTGSLKSQFFISRIDAMDHVCQESEIESTQKIASLKTQAVNNWLITIDDSLYFIIVQEWSIVVVWFSYYLNLFLIFKSQITRFSSSQFDLHEASSATKDLRSRFVFDRSQHWKKKLLMSVIVFIRRNHCYELWPGK